MAAEWKQTPTRIKSDSGKSSDEPSSRLLKCRAPLPESRTSERPAMNLNNYYDRTGNNVRQAKYAMKTIKTQPRPQCWMCAKYKPLLPWRIKLYKQKKLYGEYCTKRCADMDAWGPKFRKSHAHYLPNTKITYIRPKALAERKTNE